MYKLLLCCRYLRTRYIALASIVSVMLGVATMIVVNSVMAGFATEMQNRIHGILSDVTFEARGLDGMRDADWHMEQINKVAGESIAGMTPTVTVPALLTFQNGENSITRQVQLIGIDEKTQSGVSDFGKYLQHEANRKQMSFALREGGYDTRDHQAGPEALPRKQMEHAGWPHRRRVAEARAFYERLRQQQTPPESSPPPLEPQPDMTHMTQSVSPDDPALPSDDATATPPDDATAIPPDTIAGESPERTDPFAAAQPESSRFDPAREQHTGVVLGIALASFRTPEGEDCFLVLPGDDVKLTFPTAGTPPKPTYDSFTIVDFYESKMSEYDASFVFVPIRALQELRGMYAYQGDTKHYFVNSIQIQLKPGADGTQVRDRLRKAFAPELYGVYTWRDKQGPLLAAVEMETTILNILLFLIIAVAGFGILAIFLMIVVEKTKDIGILKSLGASGGGIMGIFLAYGLSLGIVGSGVGLVLGLLFVKYINQIADVLGWITGRQIFSPDIYYFQEIPTIVSPMTISWIVAGAMTIAVLASVLPALRAALLHPVEALRYE
ncbi:MAG: hypothetical protein A2V70_13160 [Planctomycetes bacterium RBG_13_63_9]|nr:MAG: hypothetical protein A2V70_13160 [Planctomycetes bacterium RBG_13_63_9]